MKAQQVSRRGELKGAWHRVKVGPGMERFTTWYEVCVDTQVSRLVQQKGMLALQDQNHLYFPKIFIKKEAVEERRIVGGGLMDTKTKNKNEKFIIKVVSQRG